MFNIEFTNKIQDFEKWQFVTKNNYKFANQSAFKDYFLGFYFPEFLQNENFILQYLNFDNEKGEAQWIDFLILDNNFKNVGYFATSPIFITISLPKFIRIKAGDYFSTNIIKMINVNFANVEIINSFVDNNNNELVNATNEPFVEIIN